MSRVFTIFLSGREAAQFQEALNEAKELTNVSGVFATLRRCFDLESGRLGLELQVARLDKASTRKIQTILAASAIQDSDPLPGREVRK
ncbi:MAG: hypothetical protein WB586_07305 [Chthoniobacterales bacterium]